MKYLSLLKKYLMVFVGAFLFGLAAIKVKSAQRGENKAADRVREISDSMIETTDTDINERLDKLGKQQKKAQKARQDAIDKLDKISDNSSSVKSLLNEYNRNRM